MRSLRQLAASQWRRQQQGSRPERRPGSPRQPDIVKRLAVESAAMKAAMEYFGTDRDVSDKCLGWDLEADGIEGDIYIEVKGLSGPHISVELTPNEHEKMWFHRTRYVLFVLTNAIGSTPQVTIFRYGASIDGSEGHWVSTTGQKLQIVEVLSARCFVDGESSTH
jgi:hypothetical protein